MTNTLKLLGKPPLLKRFFFPKFYRSGDVTGQSQVDRFCLWESSIPDLGVAAVRGIGDFVQSSFSRTYVLNSVNGVWQPRNQKNGNQNQGVNNNEVTENLGSTKCAILTGLQMVNISIVVSLCVKREISLCL